MDHDEGLFEGHSSRLSESGSSGPGTSERFSLATRTTRAMTPDVVLGSRQGLYLPEDHPLLSMVDRSFATFGVQGRITASSTGPSLYRLELSVPVDSLEGDALVSSLMSDRADSPILEGVAGPVVLPDN